MLMTSEELSMSLYISNIFVSTCIYTPEKMKASRISVFVVELSIKRSVVKYKLFIMKFEKVKRKIPENN